MTNEMVVDDSAAFSQILQANRDSFLRFARGVDPDQAIRDLVDYRSRVCLENKHQNLTRIVDPMDFYLGHIVDVLALQESGFLGQLNFDLGSGAGVPGLASACINREQNWVLNDSEGSKAGFLARTVSEMRLRHVTVQAGRAEDSLPHHRDILVVSRAVGPVLRIFNWIEKCSTWNKLVLLKGPAWNEEWAAFQKSGRRSRLKITGEHAYSIPGPELKSRRLVLLERC